MIHLPHQNETKVEVIDGGHIVIKQPNTKQFVFLTRDQFVTIVNLAVEVCERSIELESEYTPVEEKDDRTELMELLGIHLAQDVQSAIKGK